MLSNTISNWALGWHSGDTAGDLPKIAPRSEDRGFDEAALNGIMGWGWLRITNSVWL